MLSSLYSWRCWLSSRTLLPLAISAAITLAGPPGIAIADQATLQSIPLYTGWNLISLQVGAPGAFSPQAIIQGLGSDGGALLGIWGYDPVAGNWNVFQPAHLPVAISSLQALSPGQGYWVKMAKNSVLQLSGTPWQGTMTLQPGWNLVGFPGLAVGTAGKTDFASIFRDQFPSVPILWSFQGGALQQYSGYDSLAYPPITSLTGIQPGVGYWVYSLANVNLTPTPQIALAPDSDASPLQPQELFVAGDPRYHGANSALYLNQIVRFAGPEDAAYDLNHNGILDNPYTQDTILFQQGLNQQNFTIANSGAGLMNWYVESAASWLTFSPSAGSTSTELDSVQLTVDRADLLPGYYTNSFIIHAGALDKVVTVILQVPTVAGDYHGYATIQTVNGKTTSIGMVDLNLSLFMESEAPGETHFRAVIDRQKALLFPVDVFMNGVFYQGLNFSATTSFPMAPADRNAPPYTSFGNPDPSALQGGLLHVGSQLLLPDSDVNNNGVLDVQNLFPFGIRREVTLLGARTTADHLEGTYVEAILGVLPKNQRIYMTGAFRLDRDTLAPTTRSIYNGQTNTTVIIGGSAATSYTNTLNVAAGVQIQGVTVNMNFNYPDCSQLDVILYGPNGVSYDFGTNVAGLTSFSFTNFNNTIGRGNWSLVVNWIPSTGLRGYFNGWGLQLAGLAYYSVSGSVVAASGNATVPVSGANLVLVGSNILPQSNTTTNGSFSFDSLTENEYTLTVSMLGYYATNVAFNIDATNVTLPPIVLTPVVAANPTVTTAPFIGQAPLYVNFTPIISAATVAGLGSNIVASWDFGDGSTLLATQTVSVAHFYNGGGSYQASVTFSGSSGSTNISAAYTTALAAQPNTDSVSNTAYYVFGGGFIGSIASPIHNGNSIETTPITISNQTYHAVYQESKRDSADFDIDRYPFTNSGSLFNPNGEDTQFFVQAVHWTNGISYYDAHGVVPVPANQQFRMICTLGGCIFPPETVPWTDQSAQVGAFTLQLGRVEP